MTKHFRRATDSVGEVKPQCLQAPSCQDPVVSVVMPVHNAESFVNAAVSSVLNQTYQDYELLVLDDGSTDSSCETIMKLAGGNARVGIYQQGNQGFARSLNSLLAMARGRYLARLDADDIAEPNRLATQVEVMESCADVIVLGTMATQIDEDGDPYGVSDVPLEHHEIETQMLNGNGGIYHPTVMIRRAEVIEQGGYATNAPVVEDQELWLRLALRGKLQNLATPLTRYRVHAENMSFVRMEVATETLRSVLLAARSERGIDTEGFAMDSHANMQVVDHWERRRMWAWTAVSQGHHGTARKHACRLLAEHPLRISGWKLLCASWLPGLLNWYEQRRMS